MRASQITETSIEIIKKALYKIEDPFERSMAEEALETLLEHWRGEWPWEDE